MSFTSFILASSSSADRSSSKDDVRKEHELLSTELDSLYREHKKLKQFVEQLERDYEESKEFDPVRRYDKLKGMIKRVVLHIRLNQDDKGSNPGIGSLLQGCRDYTYQVEAGKKREERYQSKLYSVLFCHYAHCQASLIISGVIHYVSFLYINFVLILFF